MDGWNRIDADNILANPFTTSRPAGDAGPATAVHANRRALHRQIPERERRTSVVIICGRPRSCLRQITRRLHPGVGPRRRGDHLHQLAQTKTATCRSCATRLRWAAASRSARSARRKSDTPGLPTRRRHRREGADAGAPCRPATASGSTGSSARSTVPPSVATDRAPTPRTTSRSTGRRSPTSCEPSPGLLTSPGLDRARRPAGPGTEELFFSDLDYDFDQLALFGEASMALTDRFSLTGGLRWYDFEEARSQRFDELFADPLDSEGATSANGVAPRIIASLRRDRGAPGQRAGYRRASGSAAPTTRSTPRSARRRTSPPSADAPPGRTRTRSCGTTEVGVKSPPSWADAARSTPPGSTWTSATYRRR